MQDDDKIQAESWVPAVAARKFEALYLSLTLGLKTWTKEVEREKQGTRSIHLLDKRNLPPSEAVKLHMRQLYAIEGLLTNEDFRSFWVDCTEENALDFYLGWQAIFSDWITRPEISAPEKKDRVAKAQEYLSEIVELMESDTSVSFEVSAAFKLTLQGIWPPTHHHEEIRDTIELMQISTFLSRFIAQLDEENEDTHGGYPSNISAKSVEEQYFMQRLSPCITNVYGKNKHALVAEMLNKLFQLSVDRERVKKAAGKK